MICTRVSFSLMFILIACNILWFILMSLSIVSFWAIVADAKLSSALDIFVVVCCMISICIHVDHWALQDNPYWLPHVIDCALYYSFVCVKQLFLGFVPCKQFIPLCYRAFGSEIIKVISWILGGNKMFIELLVRKGIRHENAKKSSLSHSIWWCNCSKTLIYLIANGGHFLVCRLALAHCMYQTVVFGLCTMQAIHFTML